MSPYYVPSMIPNMPACEVAIDLGLHGPVTASALACASGNAALLEARRLILAGEADVVDRRRHRRRHHTGDVRRASPTWARCPPTTTIRRGASRPFSADRDGFVYGEGAVLFVVESAAHAAHARRARLRQPSPAAR